MIVIDLRNSPSKAPRPFTSLSKIPWPRIPISRWIDVAGLREGEDGGPHHLQEETRRRSRWTPPRSRTSFACAESRLSVAFDSSGLLLTTKPFRSSGRVRGQEQHGS